MNHVQWVFMAKAFKRKEEQEQERLSHTVAEIFKVSQRSLREMLIHLLGLNIGAGRPEPGEPTPYIPLTALITRPEVMEELLKRESDEKHEEEALDSSSLTDVNEGLMNLDLGDLEPVFSGQNSDDPFERWMSEPNMGLMKAIGVELYEGDLDLTKED